MHSIQGRVLLIGDGVPMGPQHLGEQPYSVVRLSALEALPNKETSADGFDDLGVDYGKQSSDWSDEIDNSCIYLHTSGTTGIISEYYHYFRPSTLTTMIAGHPKPIKYAHSHVYHLCTTVGEDRRSREGEVFYTQMPLFHVCDPLFHAAVFELIPWLGRRLCSIISQYYRRRWSHYVR